VRRNALRSVKQANARKVDFAGLGQLPQAGGVSRDHLVLPRAQLVEVDAGQLQTHAVLGGLTRFSNELCYMQECFGGYASAVQAHTSRLLGAVDQQDSPAFVRGQKGGRVAARPRTDDHQVVLLGHGSVTPARFLHVGHGAIPTSRGFLPPKAISTLPCRILSEHQKDL
jgi:hypothetical protein